MSYNAGFVGVSGVGASLIINELENNIKSYLDWGFLNIGGFVNINIPTTNISSFDLHILKPTVDKNQTPNYKVWQTPRKDWVYETGINYNGANPINISGIYVNSTLYPAPTGSGNITYKLNYPEGKVIFNSGLPASSVVQMNYSYRSIQVYKSEEFPYWKEIQHRSLENKTGFVLSDKGDFSIGTEHRVQLPAIILETVASSKSIPFRLGDKSLIIYQDILCHVLADNRNDKNNIVDILRLQEDRVIWLYNTNTVVRSGVYPLNYDGSKNLTGQNYNLIVDNNSYRWLTDRISEVSISEINFLNLRMYGSVIRLTNEIIFTSFES
jgi:hypothetical protein